MFSDMTWQNLFNGLNNQGNFNEQRHINICPIEFRNCDKLEENNTPIFTTDGIFMFDNRYFPNDHFIYSGKNSEKDKSLSRVVPEFPNITLDLHVLITSSTHFRVNPHSVVAWMSRNSLTDSKWTRIHNHLICKQTLNHLARLATLAKWLSVCLWTKRLWVQVQLQSLKSLLELTKFKALFPTYYPGSTCSTDSVQVFVGTASIKKLNFMAPFHGWGLTA